MIRNLKNLTLGGSIQDGFRIRIPWIWELFLDVVVIEHLFRIFFFSRKTTQKRPWDYLGFIFSCRLTGLSVSSVFQGNSVTHWPECVLGTQSSETQCPRIPELSPRCMGVNALKGNRKLCEKVCFMGEGEISVNEGKITCSSWNQSLPPWGANDELNWVEKKIHADVSADCIPAPRLARGLPSS